MKKVQSSFKASVFLYPGETAAWHFLGIPKDIGQRIKDLPTVGKHGFGTVRVRATIVDTTWDTSIFPDKHSGSYLLPLKAQVRKREGIQDKDTVSCTIELL